MTARPVPDPIRRAPPGLVRIVARPNVYDLLVFAIIIGIFVALAHSAKEMRTPLSQLDLEPVRLDPSLLPDYALRTTLRMFAAMAASFVFTFVVATLAAKNRKAELVIIPALDILQSVPVLGFLSFTVLFFLRMFPGRQLGAECAAIFAIFTAQAWNMTFSLYQSLRTIPRDLVDVAQHFKLSPWLRFWRLEAPFATPGLVWNAMMSMSGSWFFIVASESISVGDTKVALPGIGSWLALAIEQKNLWAVALAVGAVAIVILLYDQLVFRPIVAWADRFHFEQTGAQQRPRSWVYDLVCRARIMHRLILPLRWVGARVVAIRIPPLPTRRSMTCSRLGRAFDLIWPLVVVGGTGCALWFVIDYARSTLGPRDLMLVVALGCLTLLRVAVLITLASLIWVPIGIWIGLRPALAERVQPLAQFLAAFPANALFPFAVVAIMAFGANPSIWLSPLMILGTQWYILFNVIAGASAFPTDLREASTVFRVRNWHWWRKVILPGIFPYFITGALTASGGSWNASIVAEVARWGDIKLQAIGLGSYIAEATDAGDYPRVVLGVTVMSVLVVTFNQLLWRPLYRFAEQRFRLD